MSCACHELIVRSVRLLFVYWHDFLSFSQCALRIWYCWRFFFFRWCRIICMLLQIFNKNKFACVYMLASLVPLFSSYLTYSLSTERKWSAFLSVYQWICWILASILARFHPKMRDHISDQRISVHKSPTLIILSFSLTYCCTLANFFFLRIVKFNYSIHCKQHLSDCNETDDAVRMNYNRSIDTNNTKSRSQCIQASTCDVGDQCSRAQNITFNWIY